MTWQDYVNGLSDKYGIPRNFVNAIIQGESRGNPGIVSAPNTDGTFDYGLFQLNSGGQGLGVAPSVLLDPLRNADIAFNHPTQGLAKTYAAGVKKGLTGNDLFTYFVDNSGHRSLNIKRGVYDSSRALAFLGSSPVLAPDGSPAVALPVAGMGSNSSGGVSPWKAVQKGLTLAAGEANPTPPTPANGIVTKAIQDALDTPGNIAKSAIYYTGVFIVVALLFASGVYLTKSGVN